MATADYKPPIAGGAEKQNVFRWIGLLFLLLFRFLGAIRREFFRWMLSGFLILFFFLGASRREIFHWIRSSVLVLFLFLRAIRREFFRWIGSSVVIVFLFLGETRREVFRWFGLVMASLSFLLRKSLREIRRWTRFLFLLIYAGMRPVFRRIGVLVLPLFLFLIASIQLIFGWAGHLFLLMIAGVRRVFCWIGLLALFLFRPFIVMMRAFFRRIGILCLLVVTGVRRIVRWIGLLSCPAIIAILLIPTLRTKMMIADFLLNNIAVAPACISRARVELDLFYSQRPIQATAIDTVMLAVWVYSLSRFGPIRTRNRTGWLRVLAAVFAAIAVIGSLLTSQQCGPEQGWKCFDSLFLVAGGGTFVVYLLMLYHERRENLFGEASSPNVMSSGRSQVAQRWASMFLIAAFLAVVKDAPLLAMANMFGQDAPAQLYTAIRNDDFDMVRRMLEKDPSLADCRLAAYDAGLRPAHVAIIFGHREVLCQVLRSGAKLDATDYRGRTPLAWAALVDFDGEMANALLDKGADRNRADHDGETPLILATRRDNMAVARILVSRNAEVAICDKGGRTALHYAAKNNQVDLAKLLVEAGAPTSACDVGGNTPLSLATAEVPVAKSGRHSVAHWGGFLQSAPTDDLFLYAPRDKLLEQVVIGQLRNVVAMHDRSDFSQILDLLGGSGER